MRHLTTLNRILTVIALTLFTAASTAWIKKESMVIHPRQNISNVHTSNHFGKAPGPTLGPSLNLNHVPWTIQLPDLREELTFLGINQRPDSPKDTPIVHLNFKGSDAPISTPVGNKQYIVFDRQANKYSFSPRNSPTNLWLIVDTSQDGPMQFHLEMTTKDGALVQEPPYHAYFCLPYAPAPSTGWMMGSLRVDNSLLARQRARCYGQDLFLAMHGGPSFARLIGRERIDFLEGQETYSCHVGVGESLIWKHEKWQTPSDGENTQIYPLLHLQKTDDKLLVFELWDQGGKVKVPLTLMRSKDTFRPVNLPETLRFVAAKTWSQFDLELGADRLTVSVGDWLLLQDRGMQKLTTLKDIDAYVNRALIGELLVIDSLQRDQGKLVLTSHLFNTTRTEIQEIAIPLTSSLSTSPGLHSLLEGM